MALCVPQDAPRPPHPPSGTPSPAPQPHADTAPPPPPPPAPSSDRQPRDGPGSPQAAPQAQPPPRRQKVRTVFSQTQLLVLNERFERQRYLSLPQMRELSALLNLTYKQVKTWFQNRRMKSKRRLRSQSVLDAPGEAQMAAGPGDPGYPQAWTAAPPAPASLPPWAGYVWGGGQSWGPPPWSPQAWMGGGQAWSPAPQSLPDQPGPQIPPDVGLGDLEASVDIPEAGGYPCLDGPPGVSCFLDYDAQPGPL